MTYTVTLDYRPELPGAGRLGRQQAHDSRNRTRPYIPRALRQGVAADAGDALHVRHAPIFDQDGYGACVGNGILGACATSPCFDHLPAGHVALTEPTAMTVYARATALDAFPGTFTYPPPGGEDTGSDGGSGCKAAVELGLLSGYQWCFGLQHVLDALDDGPVCLGTWWYDSEDRPDSSGLVTISAGAQIRGGHEFVARGKRMDLRRVRCDNSWGPGWGDGGSFDLGFDDLDRLLGEGGDAVVPVPGLDPPPVPVPADDPDAAYWADPRLHAWAAAHHVKENAYAAAAYAAGAARHR